MEASNRPRQILEAALRLLAHTSVEALTTRELAVELGVSQPSLFKHFPSREALVLAVVEHARTTIEGAVLKVIDTHAPHVTRLRLLGSALLDQAEANPGLPKLLFGSVTAADGTVRDALRHLVSMQHALAAELIRESQRDGTMDPSFDPEIAASLFVGMLQALVLRWELGGRASPLATTFGPFFELFLHGSALRSTVAPDASGRFALPASPKPPALGAFARLDVCPMVSSGVDPLAAILAELDALCPSGVLVILAPFRPAPLLRLLAQKGHAVVVEPSEDRRFVVEVVKGGSPAVEDLRELEAPGPLERVLLATTTLKPGDVYLARLPRFPRLLLPKLEERRLTYATCERGDGTALLRIEKTP